MFGASLGIIAVAIELPTIEKWNAKKKSFADQGRWDFTKQETERGAFKTPGLRDITKHAPYMHDGSLGTLEKVVEHSADRTL